MGRSLVPKTTVLVRSDSGGLISRNVVDVNFSSNLAKPAPELVAPVACTGIFGLGQERRAVAVRLDAVRREEGERRGGAGEGDGAGVEAITLAAGHAVVLGRRGRGEVALLVARACSMPTPILAPSEIAGPGHHQVHRQVRPVHVQGEREIATHATTARPARAQASIHQVEGIPGAPDRAPAPPPPPPRARRRRRCSRPRRADRRRRRRWRWRRPVLALVLQQVAAT